MQVNKMNSRKEFFRVSLAEIHREVERLNQGEDFTILNWTDKAVAQEYRDSFEIENDPEKKAKWLARQKAETDRQLKRDAMQLSIPDAHGTDDDDEAT
jgi:hypothetical protein